MHTCHICSYTNKSKYKLKDHISAEHENKRYECDLCEYKAKRNRSVKVHKLRVHTSQENEDVTFHCAYCKFKAISKCDLKNHTLRKHDVNGLPATFKCDLCDCKTKTPEGLSSHKSFVHEGVTFSCNLCDFKGRSPKLLRRHIKNKH